MADRLSREDIEAYVIFLENMLESMKEQATEIDEDERNEYLFNLKEFESNLIRLKNQNYHLET